MEDKEEAVGYGRWGPALTHALALLWATRFEEALGVVHPLYTAPPSTSPLHPPGGVPSAWALHAQVLWLQALLSEHPDDIRAAFLHIDLAQKYCMGMQTKKYRKERMAEGMEAEEVTVQQLWAHMSLAETTLFDSILKFKIQKHVKGAYNFRTSWKVYEDAGKLLRTMDKSHPEYEALSCSYEFGVGLFHFMISVVPREFLWLVEAIGFKGNRTLALQEIETASNTPGIRQLEAKLMMVALKVFFFEEVETGAELLAKLLEQQSESVMVLYTAGWVHRMKGDLEMAAREFDEALKLCVECPQLRLYILFEMGCLQYISLDWPSAARYFVQFLEESRSIGVRALCHYQLGVCQAMMFHEDAAMDHMREVSKYVRKGYTHDEFADRAARKYLAKPFTNAQRKLLIARLHFEAKHFEDGLSALQQAASVAETEEELVTISYLRGECHKGLKQYDEAEQAFQEALESKKKVQTEQHIVPFSLVGLAEIELQKAHWTEARALFKQAKKYKNYDYENWVAWRIKRGQDKAKHKGAVS